MRRLYTFAFYIRVVPVPIARRAWSLHFFYGDRKSVPAERNQKTFEKTKKAPYQDNANLSGYSDPVVLRYLRTALGSPIKYILILSACSVRSLYAVFKL